MRHALCIICEEMSKDKRIEVLKVKDESNSEIKGENVRQRLIGPWSRALIGGAQPYMVGGPPSHCAI
jgi:hypothetical protein